MRTLVTIAAVAALAASLVLPASAARATFDGNACGLLGDSQFKASGLVGSSCKELPTKSGTWGSLGTLTAFAALYRNTRIRGTHQLLLIVVKASDPSAVLAYLRQNKDTLLRTLGVAGITGRSVKGSGERWFLAGGSYGVYAGLVDSTAKKRAVVKALASIEAGVKAAVS